MSSAWIGMGLDMGAACMCVAPWVRRSGGMAHRRLERCAGAVGSATSPSARPPPERAPGGAAAGVQRAPRAGLLAGGEGDEARDVGPRGVAAGGPFGGAPLRRRHAVA